MARSKDGSCCSRRLYRTALTASKLVGERRYVLA